MQSNKKIEEANQDLEIAFDVGHSSIGWAILQDTNHSDPGDDGFATPKLLGCGVVTFGADDCLAKKRRDYRRQRRHIRATRQRIARLKELLKHMGVLTQQQLDKPGCAWPWLLAARVLKGGPLLTWPEMWDVLRWYAHNRGYNANRLWSRQDDADAEDSEKVQNALHLFEQYKTNTMAETICAICGLDPLGNKKSCHLTADRRPKGLNAAFPRENIENEIKRILQQHIGHLPQINELLIKALLEDWRALPCPVIKLPPRYRGGLLLGQLVPRFDNRIIKSCPITYEREYQRCLNNSEDSEKAAQQAAKASKVPTAKCPEFLCFRWAMLLANVKISQAGNGHLRSLTIKERAEVHCQMEQKGYLTKEEFKGAVRQLTNNMPDNLDQMLMHPDSEGALVLDPVKKVLSQEPWATLWSQMSPRLQKRAIGRLRRGKSISLSELAGAAPDLKEECDRLRQVLQEYVDGQNTKKKRGKEISIRVDSG